MPSDHLSAEDLAELERLWAQSEGSEFPSFISGCEQYADYVFFLAVSEALPRLLAMVKDQGRTVNDSERRSREVVIQHRRLSRRAEKAEAEAERLRAALDRVEKIESEEDLHLLLQASGEAGEASVVRDRYLQPWILAENEHGEWWAHTYLNDDGVDILPVGLLHLPLVVLYRPRSAGDDSGGAR